MSMRRRGRRRRTSIDGQFAARLITMLESPPFRELSLSARRVLDRLESLIESFIELMSQVFMLPIFHRRTSC